MPTTPPSTVSAVLGDTDGLEAEQPLVHVLPHSTSHYRIDYRVAGHHLVLTITLLAVVNHAYQLDAAMAQLRQYKEEALDFLRTQGEDPAKYSITYQPPETTAL